MGADKIVSRMALLVPLVSVRGVSWSLLTTVPKRKLRGSLDMNFLWISGEGRLESLEEEQQKGEEQGDG